MALNTTTNPTDFAQYMQLEQHLMNILSQNAVLTTASQGLTTANITEINDSIKKIQDNIQVILTTAAGE